MKAAREAEQAVMKRKKLGPIHGIPFSIKDLTFTKGVRTMSGSHIFADRVPDQDAPFVRRLKDAGGIFIGKTTTPEFGWKALSGCPLTGDTHNPWNLADEHRRLQRGRGRGGRGGPRAAPPRLGRRGLDPRAVGLLRHLRPQAVVRPRAAVARVEQRLHDAQRADDADGGRRRADAQRDGGPRRLGPHLASTPRPPTTWASSTAA